MKLTYTRQLGLTMAIVLAFNLMTTLFRHWIFHSIGYCICGLLWIVHPVGLANMERTKKNLWFIRIAGGILVLYGIFSRAYYY